jgi:hypothetical protein
MRLKSLLVGSVLHETILLFVEKLARGLGSRNLMTTSEGSVAERPARGLNSRDLRTSKHAD